MAQNQVATQKKQTFSMAMQGEQFQRFINQTFQDKKKRDSYITGILSAVSVNRVLQECTPMSVLTASVLGESLGLNHSPQMGHYYIVPYNNSNAGEKVGQFQMGWKGYLQLAIRSGEYEKINVQAVKEGELVEYNPFDEEYKFKPIGDPTKRAKAPTIGYYAMFQLKTSGFKKGLYWTREQMLEHANKFSKGFKGKTQDSFWHKDFDQMAFKTMIRQLISKWGVMSVELQTALEKDMAVIKEDGTPDYVDTNANDLTGYQQEAIIQQDDDNGDGEVPVEVVVDEETGEVKEEKSVKSQEDLLNMILND